MLVRTLKQTGEGPADYRQACMHMKAHKRKSRERERGVIGKFLEWKGRPGVVGQEKMGRLNLTSRMKGRALRGVWNLTSY